MRKYLVKRSHELRSAWYGNSSHSVFTKWEDIGNSVRIDNLNNERFRVDAIVEVLEVDKVDRPFFFFLQLTYS